MGYARGRQDDSPCNWDIVWSDCTVLCEEGWGAAVQWPSPRNAPAGVMLQARKRVRAAYVDGGVDMRMAWVCRWSNAVT